MNTRSVYKFILSTYGKCPGVWFGLVMETIRTILLRVVSIIIVAKVTADIVSGDIATAKRDIIWYLAVNIAGLAIGLVSDLVAIRAENNEYARLISKFYSKLGGKDMMFYRNHQTGYLASLFRQHLDGVLELVKLIRVNMVRVGVSLTAPVIVLLFASWKVGLVAVAVILVQGGYIVWSSKQTTKYRKQSHEIYRKLTGTVADEITNIVAFKAAGMTDDSKSEIRKLAHAEARVFDVRHRMHAILDVPRTGFTVIGCAAAFYIIALATQGNSAAVGLAVLTVMYMFQITRNVDELSTIILQHDNLITKVEPTLEYLGDSYETIKDPLKPRQLEVTNGTVELKDVCFAYESGDGHEPMSVFENFNLHINGGEQIGVVGLSGAGKSTLIGLLMRFDDVTAGAITIDGIDIRQVPQDELHRAIAYVPQEPLLLHRTVRENIAFGVPDASDAQITAAAKAAHAYEFIEKLPQKYDTVVGERGVKLSGGQKQRIVIARAILKKAPITIFDEATSALDSASEQIIQRAMPEIIGKNTAIIVAHRLSTVAGLDRIIVMREGAIIEQGTHDELLDLQGEYHSLWQKQSRQSK